jgi:hypothetical protein
MASLAAVAEDGLSVQNVDTLDPSKLTPLTPEVISRQVRKRGPAKERLASVA